MWGYEILPFIFKQTKRKEVDDKSIICFILQKKNDICYGRFAYENLRMFENMQFQRAGIYIIVLGCTIDLIYNDTS